MLRVRILGAIDVLSDGTPIASGGARPSLALAMLAVDHGRVVGRDQMIDAIWETDPPETAVTQISIYISRLRKTLGQAEVIETVGHGYRLSTDGVEVDALVAERTLREARESQRPELFRQALAMWRGPALDGVTSSALTPAIQRLDELYLTGVEDWSAAELDSGGERALLEVLPGVVARHPLRESVRARLMEALWHSGRRPDALATYDEGRRALADELGIDPGAELARLHQQILQEPEHPGAAASSFDEPAPARAGATDPLDVPHQLPMDVAHFAGRAADVDAMRDSVGAGGALICIHGTGGVGKTTLAVHVAHQVADRFPDGQLFLNLRGYGTRDPMDTGAALGSLLRGVGVPESEIPPDEDDRSRKWRSVLAGRRILMVLDNARDSFQVRPLLPGGDTAVLVTSRSQLRSLATREGAQRIYVQEMTPSEAIDLLQARQSTQTRKTGSWAEPDVAELARLCGHLPVALAVAAERANRYSDRTLSELTAELRDSHTALDTLTAWEDDPTTSVRAVLSWSYDALDPDAARMFRLIGLHPYPALDVHAAAALDGTDLGDATRRLDRLVECHLVTERRPGEYELHDLVHAFAAHLAATQIGETARGTAITQMRAYYLHTLNDTALACHAVTDGVELTSPRPHVDTPEITNSDQASQWFTRHEPSVSATINDASDNGDYRTAMLMALLAGPLYRQHGRHDDESTMARLAVANARSTRDAPAEARCLYYLGTKTRDPDTALPHLIDAGERFANLGDGPSHERALMSQGIKLGELGRHVDAIRAMQTAVDSARSHSRVTPELLNNLAMAHLMAGRPDDGLRTAEEAVHEARRITERHEEPMTLDTLGLIHLHADRPDDAVRAFEEAVAACDPIWPTIEKPIVLLNLGVAHRAQGRTAAARESWIEAVRLLDELDAPDSDHLNRAELRALIDDPTRADDLAASFTG